MKALEEKAQSTPGTIGSVVRIFNVNNSATIYKNQIFQA